MQNDIGEHFWAWQETDAVRDCAHASGTIAAVLRA
jgi:hypothetical protein